MKFSQSILMLVLAVGLSGCSTYAIEGRYSYDTSIDYSDMKSFAFLTVDDSAFSTPESTEHYRQAMLSALSGKGFSENLENPDFEIVTHPVGTYKEEYVSVYTGRITFPKALLRVNFIRPPSGAPIYEAVADAYLDESASQESKNKTIDEAVAVILSGFPPSQE